MSEYNPIEHYKIEDDEEEENEPIGLETGDDPEKSKEETGRRISELRGEIADIEVEIEETEEMDEDPARLKELRDELIIKKQELTRLDEDFGQTQETAFHRALDTDEEE